MTAPADRPASPEAVTGLILAGGQSRRYGSDKALVLVEGRTQIRRVYDALAAVASPVYVSIAHSARRYDVPAEYLVDVFPDSGPLAGLHAGLRAATSPWLLLCACDLPYLTADSLRHLLAARSSRADAVLCRVGGRPQPVCAVYHRRILERVEQRLRDQRLSLQGLLDELESVRFVECDAASLRNVNTPADL